MYGRFQKSASGQGKTVCNAIYELAAGNIEVGFLNHRNKELLYGVSLWNFHRSRLRQDVQESVLQLKNLYIETLNEFIAFIQDDFATIRPQEYKCI